MNEKQWKIFNEFKLDFKKKILELNSFSNTLIPLQKATSKKDTPEYKIENPIVYNTALDEISKDDDIKLIVIGDNPGKNEQLNINQKYLVGQSGKIAEGFFRKNPELQTDFRKNVIILNKTPIHTAKTNHLKELSKNETAKKIILESQIWMAQKTAELHMNLVKESSKNSAPSVWLVGYSELKGNGIFLPYREMLKKAYGQNEAWNKVFVFQHFSMNRFSIDLKNASTEMPENLSLKERLETLGTFHRNEIF